MEHTVDRSKVIFRVSPWGKMWFAFHPEVNTSYNPNSFSHMGELHPTTYNRGLGIYNKKYII